MISIRRRLLLIVLVIFTVAWLVVTLATWFTARHEVEELFDAQLSREAGVLGELILDQPANTLAGPLELSREVYGHDYERFISFQVWDGDRLLVSSFGAPAEPLSDAPGFTDRLIDGGRWRVFGMPDESGRYLILAAESYRARDELIRGVILSVQVPLLLSLPLMAVMLWGGIRSGLLPLDALAAELRRRSPRQMEQLPMADAPAEVQPLVGALNDLLQRLARALEAERLFAADASHELRTPLAGIRLQAQVARRAGDAPGRDRALANIIAGVDRSTRLVEQMLMLARLDDDDAEDGLALVSLDLATLIPGVLSDLADCASAAGVRIADESAGPLSAVIRGHGPGIAILVRNLVDNAIRFSPPGALVRVGLAPRPDGCALYVEDQGSGIPEQERDRVFDAFYRSRQQADSGSGLGLAIVRRIAELHGAQIRVTSGRDQRGTRIEIRFPG